MSSGKFLSVFTFTAKSNIFISRSVPATKKLPSLYSISASDASSICPAIFLPLSKTESIVTDKAPLANAADREATEAKPVDGVLSLFPSIILTFS